MARGEVLPRVRRPKGTGTITSQGYLTIGGMKGHPLAECDGMVLAHRLVLWSAIGPGVHRCHWCPHLVVWGVSLVVDHLDGQKLDNRRANLVPSCRGCNVSRWHHGNPIDWTRKRTETAA